MKNKLLFCLSFLFMVCVTAWGQTKTVKGQVISSEDNQPLPGVAVLEKGTTNGTVTDIDGNYSINVSESSTISVSFIGFTTQEIAVAGQNVINVTLQSNSKELDDVVVVGYGVVKKSDLSGSIATVDKEAMMKRTPTNIGQALQGAAAGVIVTMQDGSPDARSAVRIRGVGTINGTSQPLYVVDGIKVGNDANFINPADIESMEVLKDASATAIYGSEGANGVIMITTKHGSKGQTHINFTADFGLQNLPYKIETLDIDKFASTVRKARANDGNTLDNTVWAEQYDGKRNEIDWQDQMTRRGLKQQYGLSATGGNDKSKYSFSVGYLDNNGIIVNTKYKRLTARANASAKALNNHLEFGGDINFTRTESYGSNIGVGNNINLSSHRDLAYMTPSLDYIDPVSGKLVNVNVVNPDGSYGSGYWNTGNGWEGNTATLANVYATQQEIARRDHTNRLAASAFIDVEFIKGLNAHSIWSWTHTATDNDDFSGGRQRFNYVDGTLTEVQYYGDNKYNFSLGQSQGTTKSIETYLTYRWETDFNTLTVMAGNTVSDYSGRWVNASAYDFISGKNRQTSLGLDDSKKKGSGGFNDDSRMISYYGRLIYNLFDRYIITATIRRDGSSNFSSAHRWGTFSSAALAWRLKEEAFLKDVDAISNAKIRLGWGQTGNAGNMGGKSVYALSATGVRYNYYQGAGITDESTMEKATGFYAPLVDLSLKWETNEQLNFGIDLGLLEGDLNITADYFIRDTKDLLIDLPIRQSAGYSSIYTNYGTIRNQGLEFSINYNKHITDDLSFNVTFNGSTLKNEVTKMGELPIYAQATGGNGTYTAIDGADGISGDGSNSFAVDGGSHWDNHSISKEGEAVGSYYGCRVEGIIRNEADLAEAKKRGQDKAQIGDFLFKDIDGNGTIDDSDREVLGNGLPKFNYGILIGANYKNFDFSIHMNGVAGQKILSYSAMRMSVMYKSDDNTTANILKDSYDEVFDNNPNGSLPRLSMLDENYNMRVSDAWVKSGNFLKINNIQVGYSLPKDLLKTLYLSNCRIYMGIQNLALFSPYKKYGDPECGQGSVLFTGLDTGRYPNPRTVMFGINVTF